MLELAQKAPSPVTYLNLGGVSGSRTSTMTSGSILPRSPKPPPTATRADRPQLPEAHTCLELGRYLVGEAGVYVTRVVDCKESRGQLYVVVDGGLHHQLAASATSGKSSGAITP